MPHEPTIIGGGSDLSDTTSQQDDTEQPEEEDVVDAPTAQDPTEPVMPGDQMADAGPQPQTDLEPRISDAGPQDTQQDQQPQTDLRAVSGDQTATPGGQPETDTGTGGTGAEPSVDIARPGGGTAEPDVTSVVESETLSGTVGGPDAAVEEGDGLQETLQERSEQVAPEPRFAQFQGAEVTESGSVKDRAREIEQQVIEQNPFVDSVQDVSVSLNPDGSFSVQLTEAGARNAAERQLEEEYGVDFTAADFEIGFNGEITLTESGREKIGAVARTETFESGPLETGPSETLVGPDLGEEQVDAREAAAARAEREVPERREPPEPEPVGETEVPAFERTETGFGVSGFGGGVGPSPTQSLAAALLPGLQGEQVELREGSTRNEFLPTVAEARRGEATTREDIRGDQFEQIPGFIEEPGQRLDVFARDLAEGAIARGFQEPAEIQAAVGLRGERVGTNVAVSGPGIQRIGGGGQNIVPGERGELDTEITESLTDRAPGFLSEEQEEALEQREEERREQFDVGEEAGQLAVGLTGSERVGRAASRLGSLQGDVAALPASTAIGIEETAERGPFKTGTQELEPAGRLESPEQIPQDVDNQSAFLEREIAERNPGVERSDINVRREDGEFEISTDLSTRDIKERVAAENPGVNADEVFIRPGSDGVRFVTPTDEEGTTEFELRQTIQERQEFFGVGEEAQEITEGVTGSEQLGEVAFGLGAVPGEAAALPASIALASDIGVEVGANLPGTVEEFGAGPTAEAALEVAGRATERTAAAAEENPERFAGQILGETILGTAALRGTSRAANVPRRARIRARSEGRVDFEDITSERGARGELPEFETEPGAPTERAVREVRERAAGAPDPIEEGVGTERALFQSTEADLGPEFTAQRGRSELPGLFTSPDASPLRLSLAGESSLASLRPRLPGLSDVTPDQPGRLAAFPGERVRGMPRSARGSGRIFDPDEGDFIPDPETSGARFLEGPAEEGTAFVRPEGGRTTELEAIFPPGSQFEQTGTVAVRAGGRQLPLPGERSVRLGGQTVELGLFQRARRPDADIPDDIDDAEEFVSTQEILEETRRPTESPEGTPVTPFGTFGSPTAAGAEPSPPGRTVPASEPATGLGATTTFAATDSPESLFGVPTEPTPTGPPTEPVPPTTGAPTEPTRPPTSPPTGPPTGAPPSGPTEPPTGPPGPPTSGPPTGPSRPPTSPPASPTGPPGTPLLPGLPGGPPGTVLEPEVQRDRGEDEREPIAPAGQRFRNPIQSALGGLFGAVETFGQQPPEAEPAEMEDEEFQPFGGFGGFL